MSLHFLFQWRVCVNLFSVHPELSHIFLTLKQESTSSSSSSSSSSDSDSEVSPASEVNMQNNSDLPSHTQKHTPHFTPGA